MDRLLTVLVQTSPVPSHPSAALLEALFRSFDRVDGLREATIIILCDGLGGEGEEGETEGEAPANLKHGRAPDELAARYGEHLDLLRERLDRPPFLPPGGGGNPGTAAAAAAAAVRMVRLPHRHGSARAIGAAFDMGLVRTPFVMVAQHDNFFVRDVPLREVLVAMRQHDWIKALHFQATATVNYVEKVRRRYGMDLEGMVRRDWAKGGGGGRTRTGTGNRTPSRRSCLWPSGTGGRTWPGRTTTSTSCSIGPCGWVIISRSSWG
jgi:hypothetical protein